MSEDQDGLTLASSLLAQGRKSEAFGQLVKARAVTDDTERLDTIAGMMEQADQMGSAHELRRFIVGANPNDILAQLEYLRVGQIVVRGDPSGLKTVENELDLLVDRLPADAAGLWLKAANLYQCMLLPGRAMRAVKMAIAAGSDSPENLFLIAHFYTGTGRRWRAWWTLRKLFRQVGLSKNRLMELSSVSRQARCPKSAIGFARRIQALDPDDLNATVLEAQALLEQRRVRNAAALIKTRLDDFKMLQDNGHLALKASTILLAGGELDAELSLLLHAAATWPHNAAVTTALEVAQFATKASSWASNSRL